MDDTEDLCEEAIDADERTENDTDGLEDIDEMEEEQEDCVHVDISDTVDGFHEPNGSSSETTEANLGAHDEVYSSVLDKWGKKNVKLCSADFRQIQTFEHVFFYTFVASSKLPFIRLERMDPKLVFVFLDGETVRFMLFLQGSQQKHCHNVESRCTVIHFD